jgi:hypothetical protein
MKIVLFFDSSSQYWAIFASSRDIQSNLTI